MQTEIPHDPPKEFLLSVFRAIEGQPGDYVVGAVTVLTAYALYRRRYKLAVGLLVLIGGVVLLRVIVNMFFGDVL
ncbi:MAG: hypothetical protein KDD69_12550 [Bdellovibrionales bacterium]|nr:hypothetical protein [Bdellovibrionales bacterium]